MPRSMTGFGRGEAPLGARRLSIEIRAVNHRYLDVRLALPPGYGRYGSGLEKQLRQAFSRGRLDLGMTVSKALGVMSTVRVDADLARSYKGAAEELKALTEVEGQVGLEQLLALPGVVLSGADDEEEPDAEAIAKAIRVAAAEAISGLQQMRDTEGRILARALEGHLSQIRTWTGDIEARAENSVVEKRARLNARLETLLSGHEVDPTRLAHEVAVLCDRLDISEELERLSAHCEHMQDILQDDEPIGRKLDFLTQEMNREANTIGSKCADAAIAQTVVEMKAELERLREQIQNLE